MQRPNVMHGIRTELHCHNVFSNFNVGSMEAPYDCSVTVDAQLRAALDAGLDALFVTNHNTLDGYAQALDYAGDHARYSGISVYPAEEITLDGGAHVIAYGIYKEIEAGQTLHETLDEIRRQGAVSSAPHPFSILDALRESAAECDMVEVFNSNNADVISNARAATFADEHDMVGVAGSDSHVSSTLGRCVNVIDAEANLDSVLDSLGAGRVSIQETGYATGREAIEHIRYKIENSAEYIDEYMARFYPHSRHFFSLLLRLFKRNPDSRLWMMLYRLAVIGMRRISHKINFENRDAAPMSGRNLASMARFAI